MSMIRPMKATMSKSLLASRSPSTAPMMDSGKGEHDDERLDERTELRREDHVDEDDGQDQSDRKGGEHLPILFDLTAELIGHSSGEANPRSARR